MSRGGLSRGERNGDSNELSALRDCPPTYSMLSLNSQETSEPPKESRFLHKNRLLPVDFEKLQKFILCQQLVNTYFCSKLVLLEWLQRSFWIQFIIPTKWR